MTRARSFLLVALIATLTSSGAVDASPVVLPPSLWVSAINGDDATRLEKYTNFGADAPDWSPDSTRLVYDGVRLFIIDVESGEAEQITPDDESDSSPDWSPDGSSIAFARYTDGDRRGIHIYDVNSGETRRLTTGRDSSPDWSPDGKEIAFDRDRGEPGVYVVDVLTGMERKLVVDQVSAPLWSPDGEWIAYATSEVFIVRPDGSEVTNLSRTIHNPWDEVETWSPDGSQLAFVNEGRRFFISDVATRKRTRVKVSTDSSIWDVDWAPDGRRVVISDFRYLYSVRPDGTGLRRLTRGDSPSVSPDGNRLAFLRH